CVAGAGALHAPPAQLSALVSTLPMQLAGTQTVPLGHVEHAPDPSHVPVWPQVATGCAAQTPCGSAWPAATAPHTPSAPCPFLAAVHASQAPVQAWLQQTPSAQVSPLAQSDVAEQ